MDVTCASPKVDIPTEEKDNRPKKINNLKEEDSATIFDETGSKNVIDANAMTSNKETEHAMVLDVTLSKKTDDKDIKESGNARVLGEIGSKNDKEIESIIILDASESKNTVVIGDKDSKHTESSINLDEEESGNVVILDGNKTDSDGVIVLTDRIDSESTIILDDDEVSKLSKRFPAHSVIIDVDKDTDCSIVEPSCSTTKERNAIYDNIFKENTLLAELIEKCLNMENTNGMSRVINRTLLAIYKDLDDNYKKSDAFRKVLTRTIMQLDLEPGRKFLHLKNLCDGLKVHKVKKRVNYITLEEVSKDKQSISTIPTKRRRVDAIIDLDDDNQSNHAQGKNTVQNNENQRRPKEYPPIEIDDDSSSDALSDIGDNRDVILVDANDNTNKENNRKARSKIKVSIKKTKKRKRNKSRKINRKKIVKNPFHISKSKSSRNQIDSLNMDQDINRLQGMEFISGSLLEPRHNLDPGSLLEPRHNLDPGSLLEPRHKLVPELQIEPRLTPGLLLVPRLTPGSILETRHMSEPGLLLEPRHIDAGSLLKPRLTPDTGSLLEPRHTSGAMTIFEHNGNMAIEVNKEKIKIIESKIASLKKQVEHFEEMEVETDTYTSPYILCEQAKAAIVNLYKELCQLTGTEVTKRHEVRLQVVRGHPKGPVRCLEEFLNSNIDEDGNPPFPDMDDVIQCVCQANVRFNMNWKRAQIMSEAQALFTQLGRSMQKRRQKREWKDLMSLVKQEAPDPAELDPALQARLLENTRLARKNEDELLSRFAQMEQGVVDPTDPKLSLRIDQSGDSEDSDFKTPEMGDGISTVDYSPTPNGASDNIPVVSLLGTIGSITVSGGNIVIQPTNEYGDGPNYHSLPNNMQQKSIASNSGISFYLSEYHSFLSKKSEEAPKIQARINNDFSIITNRCGQSEIINSNNLAKENATVVQNTPSTEINENYLAKITNLAKNIVSLVQTDLSPKTNDITCEKNYLVKTNSLVSTMKSTNFDQSCSFVKINECSSAANSDFKANDSNLECKENDKTHEDGFHIFTHSTKPKSKNNTGISNSQDNTPSENVHDNVTSQMEIEETNRVSEELKFQTDIDSEVENKEGIVKPEPLDIPSMLEELGQGFTATIFDIEDPFLVIEISDSSESEDEEM